MGRSKKTKKKGSLGNLSLLHYKTLSYRPMILAPTEANFNYLYKYTEIFKFQTHY